MKKGRIQLVTSGSNEPGMFDDRPIKLDGFELRHNAALAVGKPGIKQWQAALVFAEATHESAPFWIGDLVAYADDRADWREKLDQAKAITKLAEQTLHNLGSVARKVAQPERDLAPSFSHAAIVAKLPARDQHKWLAKAKTEGWTRRELDVELKASQKRGVLTGSADLEGMYRVWLADFPWKYGQAQPSKVSAGTHYPGMTVDEGIAMGDMVQAHTMKNAVLFFWVTAPFLYYATNPELGPDAYRIMRAWGFTPKTGGVWDKVDHNYGHYLSIRHEHLIIAVRGEAMTPDRPNPMFDSVFVERRSDVHSQKPELVAQMIERLYDGPYAELFARDERAGWSCWGNQVNAAVRRAG